MNAEHHPEGTAREIFIARQPIFDRHAQVSGYELLFRGGRENRFDATDHNLASATTLEQSANAFGLDHLVGERMAWVNLTREALVRDYYTTATCSSPACSPWSTPWWDGLCVKSSMASRFRTPCARR